MLLFPKHAEQRSCCRHAVDQTLATLCERFPRLRDIVRPGRPCGVEMSFPCPACRTPVLRQLGLIRCTAGDPASGAGKPEAPDPALEAGGGRPFAFIRPRSEREELLRRQMASMQAELDAYKAALDQHAIVVITDPSGRITHFNQAFCAITGYDRDELIGQNHNIINSGYHPPSFFGDMWRTIKQGGIWHAEICNRTKAGALYWVDTTIVPFNDEHGGRSGYVSIRYDITKRKQAEALLLDVIETIPDGVAAFDADERLILFNRAYRDYHDRLADRLRLDMSFEEIVDLVVERNQIQLAGAHPARKDAWKEARIRSFRKPGKPHNQLLADGTWLQVQDRRSASGNTVSVRTDITELKSAEITIKNQAQRDSLTGLYNRSVLLDVLERACQRSGQPSQWGALVMADLDGFKSINDTLGHAAGDKLLVEIARRLRAALRASDVVVRLGGDEFAFLLSRTSSTAAIERLMKRVARAVRAPVAVGSRRIEPACSFGVCLFPQHGRTPFELMKHADIALYEAKAHNRGGFQMFHEGMRRSLEKREKLATALRNDVARERVEIALQPQVDLDDCSHVGFEALARWTRNEKPVPPAEFISVAEDTGQIIELGNLVLDKALSAARAMKTAGFEVGIIAVNVAAAQLRTVDFVDQLGARLARFGIESKAFEVEITENVLLDGASGGILSALTALKRLGVHIALDDFGTGYASLTHLKQFPVDRIKIDRSFVRDITTDPDDAAICKATIGLAHSLGLKVVAEGIETAAQRAFLARHGCDFGQGYLFGKPLQGEALAAYVASRTRPDIVAAE